MPQKQISSEVTFIKTHTSDSEAKQDKQFRSEHKHKVTLVQSLCLRKYSNSIQTRGNHQLCVITILSHTSLTLIMSECNPLRPHITNGLVKVDVHRKFLPYYGKFLHWISFIFMGSCLRVQAQIMLPGRLDAAYTMVEGGAAACFVNSPFRLERRAQRKNKRQIIQNCR